MLELLKRLPGRLPSWAGLCAGLLLAAALHGQTLAFRRFDGRDGLPQSQVRVLLEDRQGFLWVGTHGGVARLGASGFKSFGIAQGLGVGRVRALLQDPSGAIWVAQSDAGLARIEGSQVRTFTAADGMGDRNCYALALEPSGAVVVGTSDGLHRWDGRGFQRVELGTWGREPVLAMVRAGSGVWLGGRKGLVGFWDGRTLQEHRLPVAPADVWKLVVDPAQRVWALTRPGLFRREASGWVAVPLEGLTDVPKIQDLNFDRDGGMAASLGSGGLYLRPAQGAPRILTHADGLPEEQVNIGYRDRHGILWVGTDGEGLHALVLPTLRALRGTGILELGAVLAMEPRPGGGLLLGTSRGLFLFEEGKGVTTKWSMKDGLPDNEVWCITPDGAGGMWLGTAKGLARWRNGRVSPGRLLGDARIYEVIQWRGRNLVGTELGLSELDASGSPGRSFNLPREAGISDAYVLLAETEGVLVGSSKGMYRFDGSALRRIFPDAPFKDTRVVALHRDGKGALCVGTVQGFYRQAGGGWTFTGVDQGLPDAHIYFVGDGGGERLVLGHGKGVTVLEPSGRLLNLNQGLGLLSDETNQGAVRLDEQGRLWFGMINGLCILDTREPLRVPELPAPQVLEVLWPRGRALLPKSLDLPPRPDFIEFDFEVGLPITSRPPVYEVRMDGLSDDWQRTGEVHSMRFGRLNAGTYAFRVRASLDGLHWVEGQPIGLRVRPTWYEHPAGRAALGLLVVAAVLAVVQWRTLRLKAAARVLESRVEERTRSLDQRNRELEAAHAQVKEALNAKVAFTRMVIHDLRSPITTMNLLSDQMSLEAQDRGEAPPHQLELMGRESARLEGLLRRLLDQSRSEAVDQTLHMVPSDPRKLVDGMEEGLRLKAEGAGLAFTWEVQPTEGRVLADALAVQQVLLNLFGNALKVTGPGGAVGMRSRPADGGWVLEIWDTGRGLDPEQVERLFRPFTQVEITDVGQGWGLGLSIVKALVDAHGARIEVDSAPGKGTTFRIRFPLVEGN
jgi:signal transduction histidine kinase/ligand-binding sensor domain-containing protein